MPADAAIAGEVETVAEEGPALGHQYTVELYGCEAAVLDDVTSVEKHLLAAAKACGATIVSSTFHRFSPQGVSGVVVITESHLAVHTWPEHRYAAVDLFTCGTSLRPEAAVECLKAQFRAARCSVVKAPRGRLAEL